MFPNPLLIHLHIPKTAGVTLRRIEDRQYPADAICTLPSEDADRQVETQSFTAEQKQGIALVRGHFPFGVHEMFDRPGRYFTLLRDPVDRIISLYHYGQEGRSQWIYKLIRKQNMTLADFAASSFAQTNNHQTRLISGDLDGGPDSLGKAKQNLENHFVAVGVSERFDETLLLLQRLLGWNNVHYYRRNVTRNRPDRSMVDREVIRNIEQHNKLDVELHAFARSMLAEALAANGITDGVLRRFRRINRFHEGGGVMLDLATRLLPGPLKERIKTVVPFRR